MEASPHNLEAKSFKKSGLICSVCKTDISIEKVNHCLDCDIYCHPICSSQLLNNCTATKRPKKMKSVPTIPRSTSVSQNSPPSIGVVGSAPNAGYLSRATSVTVTPPRVPPPVPARSAFVDDEEGRPRSKSFATNPAVVDSLISPRQNGNVQPSFIRSLQNSSAAVSTNTNYNSESSSSSKRFSTSVAGSGYSSMNAYEPALKVRPLPPLPGKEKPGNNGPPSVSSLKSSSSSVSSRQSVSLNNNSASPPAPSSPRELSEEETRNRIVQEILSTEDAYVKSLGTITTIFLPPIKAIIKDKYISDADFKALFSNIEVILQFNSEFYKELKTCIDSWGPLQLLGPIFLKLAPFLKMYTAYASNYNVALEVLKKLRDAPKTNDLLEDLRKKAGNDIEAFLIKPVQRVPRYQLLLRDLLKHTVESHPDYKNIEDSLNKMKDIADHINSFVRNQQNSQKVLDLGMQNFVAPHRQFVRDGIVTAEVMATSKRYQLQFALFSDILIKNENPKKKIKPHKAKYQWTLKLVWIKDHPNSADFSFEIIGPDNAYIVYCTTPEEKAGWMQDLLGYILAALKYKKDDQRRYGKFSYNDGSVYEGWWSDGTRHGVGTWTHMGNKYVGEWKSNKKNGQGTMNYFTASTYKGAWKDDSPSGVGTFTDPYGNVYEGEWLNGKKDGRGALKYKNGDVYEGSFKEDLFDGLGILTMTNGMRYEGNWQRGQFHGKGTLVHPSGKKYDGQWQYGLKHGSGTLIRVNGDNYVGEWANNKRHGQGTLDQTNSDGTVYSGTFFEGKYDGNGTVKYRDGSKYEGLWRTGERHGKGTFYFYGSSSLKYTGEWARDVKNGQGQLVLVNGSRYEGSFKDDRPHGPGVFIDINGTTIEGKWFEGVLEGKCTMKINKPLAEQENGASSSSSKKSKDYVMVLSGNALGSTIEIAESKAIKFPTSMPRAPDIQALTLPSFCLK